MPEDELVTRMNMVELVWADVYDPWTVLRQMRVHANLASPRLYREEFSVAEPERAIAAWNALSFRGMHLLHSSSSK